MIARATATFACCGAPATPDRLSGHKCNDSNHRDHRSASDTGSHDPVQVRSRRTVPATSRAGKAAEDALADVLSGPYVVLPFAAWIRAPHVRPDVIVREFEWGIGLVPRRRFRCDFLHLTSATMVEIEGGAHGVQRQRKHDVLRDQLAQQAGYRIVRVLPEQVRDGSALALVRQKLGGA